MTVSLVGRFNLTNHVRNTYWREAVCMYNMWEKVQHQGKLESTSDYSYDKKTLGDPATALI